jgi:hypothetical protein
MVKKAFKVIVEVDPNQDVNHAEAIKAAITLFDYKVEEVTEIDEGE